MPRYVLTDDEIKLLIRASLKLGGEPAIDDLFSRCHEFKTFGGLTLHERYFTKKIAYMDFEVHIPHFLSTDDDVDEIDIQFKRPSRFPSPYVNRNRPLVDRLLATIRTWFVKPAVVVKDNQGGRQMHFNVSSESSRWYAETPFDEWESECAIYDEPHSSGQTDPSETHIRNDFVIFRFKRKLA